MQSPAGPSGHDGKMNCAMLMGMSAGDSRSSGGDGDDSDIECAGGGLTMTTAAAKRSAEKAALGDCEGGKKPEAAPKKAPPPNGKKTKGRVKIKMEFIDNKLRRYTTFSKRKTGIMKKAYELSTLTGTQVMLLVASETGHVYTFATRKLQPMITSEAGKALIQTCLNSPDPALGISHQLDQRMSATGFEETELTYSITDEDQKVRYINLDGFDRELPEWMSSLLPVRSAT